MKNQSTPNQTDIEVTDIDFDKLCRIGKKVQVLLFRKIDDPIEIYLLLKILCFSIEESFGYRLDSDEEQKFKEMFS
ncbi:MAG: hypothetical protein NWE92_11855 [Candidatus Bathyarchaeota archaeon]|nr:hypothetical protein [Candidatus Bathyarchaeota archaeon]